MRVITQVEITSNSNLNGPMWAADGPPALMVESRDSEVERKKTSR